MNAAQAHLALNQFPLIALMIGIGVMIFGFIRKYPLLLRTASWIFVVATIVIIPVYYTGEGAEEKVEDASHVSHDYIEKHEDAGKLALWSFLLLGLLSGTYLAIPSTHPYSRLLPFAIAFVSVLVLLAVGFTTHQGARISHPELRETSSLPIK